MHRLAGYGLLAALALVAACQRSVLAPGQGGHPAGGAGAGGAPPGQACARYDTPAHPLFIPSVVILLDASGTMNEDANNMPCDGGCGAGSKWAQATAAINALVAQTEVSANWGLKFFADTGSCGVSGGVAVPITTGNATAIANAIAARTNASGGVSNPSNTPTRAAESAAASYLPTLGVQGRRLILLVTDGATNCAPEDINADDSPAAIQAVADAFSSGFPTIVVGTSAAGGPTEAVLTAMANAGGYARAGASPAYYPLSAVGDLAGTVADLTFSITDCAYPIPTAPSGAEPNIDVLVDGVAIPRDDGSGDGWGWTDASTSVVRFFGALCDDLKAGKHQNITFAFYCDTR